MPIRIPSLSKQRRIAAELGALDDKIELNRRMSQTLESMARALFKSWFVDFDPVHARAEGRESGLPSAVAELFPACVEDSDLGEIPAGWRVADVGDLIELAYGKAMKAEDRKPGPVAVYGSNGQVGWHDEALARGPGIVVGRKGNPGTVIWVTGDFFPIDTAFYVVPKSPQLGLGFLYHALRNHDLASLGADSAVPGLNRNLAYMSRQLVPPMPIVDEFDRLVKGLSQRGHTCALEASSLSALRDALLLQLLSGPASMPGGGMTLGAS
jgi:type I restriction enzyme S subunit